MRHEVEFLLDDVLQPVVDVQPVDHPLRRVDRDNSTVYETGSTIDMQEPVSKRKDDLKKANYIGVASQSGTPTPVGPGQRYELQSVASVRLEGLTADEFGHIDGVSQDAVPFEALFREVFDAIRGEISYPDVGRPGVTYRDLTITNVDDAQSEYADFYRAEFDVQFRGYTDTP
ncbi:hypothetical protein PM038_00040 [Halorubrum ezzemoulense]|uniref:hypothetical protein n=1 Tax=Halorubrum ezzemoulense TaxID=337243 RepID=UPI00232E06FD|nr:hypothetical protein [Halorubrum ezzemoulense]MDB2283664.1 hypothetical protein [Halorubrum ezzemoulense]